MNTTTETLNIKEEFIKSFIVNFGQLLCLIIFGVLAYCASHSLAKEFCKKLNNRPRDRDIFEA
jgi:hypothetical protein